MEQGDPGGKDQAELDTVQFNAIPRAAYRTETDHRAGRRDAS